MSASNVTNRTLRRTATEIRKYRLMKKALGFIALALVLLITAGYVLSVVYSKFGSFTVTVNKFDNLNYSIALSETIDGNNQVTRLNCGAVKEITNISGTELPMDIIGSVDGESNGDNYLCYTFYLLNNGSAGVNIDYYIITANTTMNLDEAIRVMVISSRDNAPRTIETFAKAAYVNDNHETVPEEGTTAFVDNYTVCQDKITSFLPGEIVKYTVVIWLEGNDKDCTDALLGGSFKMDMKFEISGVVEGN